MIVETNSGAAKGVYFSNRRRDAANTPARCIRFGRESTPVYVRESKRVIRDNIAGNAIEVSPSVGVRV